MTMDWKRKLASRKFWVCVCGFVTAMLSAFRLGGEAERVTAVLMAFGTLISYILAEGFVDAAAAEGAIDASSADVISDNALSADVSSSDATFADASAADDGNTPVVK